MRIHVLQHVPFEGPANLARWAARRNHAVRVSELYRETLVPDWSGLDWLVVLGGPMNVYEEQQYPWLSEEKKYIEAAIREGKVVIGICLGAQLIADVLGARVYRNPDREIGWYPVSKTTEAQASPAFKTLPGQFMAFHWHGDTFSIPEGAVSLAESAACANQAFQYGTRVLGLQFHLEYSAESIGFMLEHCFDELVPGRFVQSAAEIRAQEENLSSLEYTFSTLFGALEREYLQSSAVHCAE